MATQDDSGSNQTKRDLATSQQEIATQKSGSGQMMVSETGTDPAMSVVLSTQHEITDPDHADGTLSRSKITPKRGARFNQAKMAARLHRVRLTTQTPLEADAPTRPGLVELEEMDEAASPTGIARKRRDKKRDDSLDNWQNWSKFRLWRHTRPLWGSILIILAAIIMLVFPLSLLQFAFLVGSFWASMVIGGVLLVMGIIPLFLPSYAVVTGSIGMVLSLVSFITNTFGGFAVGMLLGIIGCALSIAWRPVKRSRLVAASSSPNT